MSGLPSSAPDFAGLGAAITLSNEGYGGDDLLLLERRSGVGGTWHDNSYPGCRCDVPSNLYSFSFAPNPGWTETFSGQPEIERYLQKTARDYGVLDRIAFDAALEGAMGRRPRPCGGSRLAGVADGGLLDQRRRWLSEPAIPEFTGASAFAGTRSTRPSGTRRTT